MAFTTNPALNQQMAQLEQEYAQRKANIMQSFYSQQQQQQQNSWNQQSVQAQAPTQNVNWIYVSGIEGARNQIVQLGCTAWMMDNNEPYIYAKAVDKFGTPDFHIFRIEEVKDISTAQVEQPQIDLSQYVHRYEFESLRLQLEQFTNELKKQPARANKEVVSDGESINGNDGKTGTGRGAGRK